MNCNEKGVRGLVKVIDDLQDKGFYCFLAFDDHSPIDIIAVDRTGRTYRLQVKYRNKIQDRKKESYSLPTESVVNGKRVPINRNMIDGWAIYMADAKKVCYVNKNLMENKKEISLDPNKDYGTLESWQSPANRAPLLRDAG